MSLITLLINELINVYETFFNFFQINRLENLLAYEGILPRKW
ncbi:hypothetical protein [Mycoplasma suis]|nr:hypothetical protein [Mycoplasma suis]